MNKEKFDKILIADKNIIDRAMIKKFDEDKDVYKRQPLYYYTITLE